MIGEAPSRYRLIEKVGEGASGVIYKAEDLSLGRLVALKCLPTASAQSSGAIRFQHEARIASNIGHPNVCTIYEIGEHDGQPFIALEWLEGKTLACRLRQSALAPDELIDFAIQIADGLSAIHAEGIVHRDIKPANIFLTSKGQVKILDFGVSLLMPRAPAAITTSTMLPVGTAGYMSPEQLRGLELDARSDMFSAGIVLYEMATQRHPFSGGTAADVMRRILDLAPVPLSLVNPDVPAEFERVVTKALEKDRKLRYQTASDLCADLQRLKRDAGMRPAHRPPVRGASRNAVAARLLGSAVAVMLVSVLIFLARADDGTPPETPPAPAAHAAAESAADVLVDAQPLLPAAPSRSASSRARTVPPDAADAAPARRGGDVAAAEASTGIDQELAIARAKLQAGLNDQALETIRGVLTRHGRAPEAIDAYLLMARIQEAQNNVDDAMGTYLEIAERYKGRARAAQALYRYAELTLTSRRAGRDEEARKVLRKIAERHAGTEWAVRALLKKAEIEERTRVFQLDPVLGASVPAALVTYRSVVEQYSSAPGLDRALVHLAELYDRTRRFDLAADTFATLAKRFPDAAPDAWYRAAEIHRRRLSDDRRAREAYARVPRSSKYYPDAQDRLR